MSNFHILSKVTEWSRKIETGGRRLGIHAISSDLILDPLMLPKNTEEFDLKIESGVNPECGFKMWP